MKNFKKSQYSLRKTLTTGKHSTSVPKAPNTSTRIMARTAEKVKTGVKRSRGRPRTKESKSTTSAKRHKPSRASSANGTKSSPRDGSSSPTHQEPPQLEPMPAMDEDDDLDIPMGFSSLISVDDHLCPGKCIVICPVANCRKKFSNPIDLVSHLRIYHENDTFSSVKIFTCPICLKTRFSSHTTSSDLTLLTEHAARYHGQTLKQTEFIYFCTIVLDVVTGDKSTQKKEENNLLKKEAGCMIQQPNSDSQYHPILPLVPNSTAPETRTDVNSAKVARVTTDTLGLRMPSTTGHFIQISPVSQRLANNAITTPAACSTAPQPVFAALAAVAGQLSTGGTPTLLLSSTTTNNTVSTTGSEQPILIAPSGGICAAPNPTKPLSDANPTNTMTSTLQPHSPSAATIATLKQLIQSASAAVKSQQPSPVMAQTPNPGNLTSAVATSTAATLLSTLPSVQASSAQSSPTCTGKVVTKVEQPSSTTPLSYPFVQGPTMVASPVPELDSNCDLSSFASANADLLTLARLSVNQASAEAISISNNNSTSSNNSVSGSIQEPSLPPSTQTSQTNSSSAPRNRRLLPRKTTSATVPTPVVSPILLRKRVALPPLAVKPPKESTTFLTNTTAQSTLSATQQSQSSVHNPLLSSGGGVDGVGVSEEAPVMTAALINPSCPSPATTTLIPSNLGSMLAKPRLLQASASPSAYISVQPRPTLPSPSTTSTQHQQHSYQQQPQQLLQQQLIQRLAPTMRPAPLQKILPRPNNTSTQTSTPTSVSTPITSTTITTGVGGKEMRPLLYSMPAPLIAHTPVTNIANATTVTQIGSGCSGGTMIPNPSSNSGVAASSTITPIKASISTSASHVNGNGASTVPTTAVTTAAAVVPNNSVPSDDGPSALVICTSPSELNIST